MDARQFLAEFGHIASAPGGVQAIRELVLQFAISGDLIPRVPGDILAAEVFALNQRERAKLVGLGQIKRQPPAAKIVDSDQPWPLPDGWLWCRLGDLTDYGQSPKVEIDNVEDGTWVLELEDIEKGTSRLLQRVRALARRFKSTKNGFSKGRVLYGKLRPYLDKVLIADEDGVCTTEIIPISFFAGIEATYLRWYLKSPFFISYATGSTHGMNLPRLGTEAARNALFPLAPAEEQKRIVAKVDDLMALCDKLENQQQERGKLCKTTRNTAFGCLAAARTRDEIHVALRRIEAHAPLMLDTPESVESYKSAMLDLAVSGLLLGPYDRSDKTGEELLQEIAERRLAWIREAQDQELKEALGMQKKLRTQHIANIETALPSHWAWGSLLQLSQVVVDCHNKTAPYVAEGIHLVRTTDIRNGRMDLGSTRKISADTYAYWARRLPPRAGDVFFTREAPMGEAAIVPKNEMVCLGQRSMLIRLFPELFNNRFLLYVIYSPSFQARMKEAAIGMTVKHLRVGGVEDLMVPVPPKSEQDRIVAIVDDLFAHCDRLATQLSRKLSTASNLAKASVGAITGIRIEDQETMKAPKIELVSRLRLGVSPADKDQAPLAALLIRNQGELAAKTLWQASGLEIDAFYRQLKAEMARGWIVEPEPAYVREVAAS